MAFVKNRTIGDMVGCWVILTKPVSTLAGTFEIGSRVRITDTDLRGTTICFSIEDGEGNSAHDIPGWAFEFEYE